METQLNAECEIKGRFLFIRVSKLNYGGAAEFLKNKGFRRLLTVSAVDWLEEKEFEVYYIVHNPTKNFYAKVATRIPRDETRIQSLSSLWENSAMHEREIWELFGITFDGNAMLKSLFLEKWDGPPPFRKEFDWKKYVKETYESNP